jgi:hypothetical protein
MVDLYQHFSLLVLSILFKGSFKTICRSIYSKSHVITMDFRGLMKTFKLVLAHGLSVHHNGDGPRFLKLICARWCVTLPPWLIHWQVFVFRSSKLKCYRTSGSLAPTKPRLSLPRSNHQGRLSSLQMPTAHILMVGCIMLCKRLANALMGRRIFGCQYRNRLRDICWYAAFDHQRVRYPEQKHQSVILQDEGQTIPSPKLL